MHESSRYQEAPRVGITYLNLDVGNPADPDHTLEVEFMVDSGAIYTVARASVVNELNIKPISDETFWLTNGEKLVRQRGIALFKYAGKVGGADVVSAKTATRICSARRRWSRWDWRSTRSSAN